MTDYSSGCAWVDGEFVPYEAATVPIADTGFQHADLTYDVVGVWGGAFFRLDDHLDRFEKSWQTICMNPPVTRSEMREILFECVRRSSLREAFVDMLVTRGIPHSRTADPRTFVNRFYAYAIPYVWIVPAERQETGSHLVIAENTIRIPPEAVDPTVKNHHWGDLMQGMFEAFDRGGDLVVLPDAAGNVTEGNGFNVFAVAGERLYTPDRGVLEGVTRRTVIELASSVGIDTVVAPLPVDDVRAADELFVTSTAGGVMPVTVLDGETIGDGKPGPVTIRVRDLYWAAHSDPAYITPVDY